MSKEVVEAQLVVGSEPQDAGDVLASVGDAYSLVMVQCSAQPPRAGVQRLPDRFDRGRRVAAVQVATEPEARAVFRKLDGPHRIFYVDVERKQELDLVGIADEEISFGSAIGIKPNDLTVDALDAVVTDHYGADLSRLRVAIHGTGNLAFKFALRLVERGASVGLVGRDEQKAQLLCDAIAAVIPRHTQARAQVGRPEKADLLVSAVTAKHLVDETWLEVLVDSTLCVDVGIDNFSPEFIEGAHRLGATCMRLDVRAAGDQLPSDRTFFRDVAGRAERLGIAIVAGGFIGREGEVVVDQIANPGRVLGIASGTGGLLDRYLWTEEQRESYERVRNSLTEVGGQFSTGPTCAKRAPE